MAEKRACDALADAAKTTCEEALLEYKTVRNVAEKIQIELKMMSEDSNTTELEAFAEIFDGAAVVVNAASGDWGDKAESAFQAIGNLLGAMAKARRDEKLNEYQRAKLDNLSIELDISRKKFNLSRKVAVKFLDQLWSCADQFEPKTGRFDITIGAEHYSNFPDLSVGVLQGVSGMVMNISEIFAAAGLSEAQYRSAMAASAHAVATSGGKAEKEYIDGTLRFTISGQVPLVPVSPPPVPTERFTRFLDDPTLTFKYKGEAIAKVTLDEYTRRDRQPDKVRTEGFQAILSGEVRLAMVIKWSRFNPGQTTALIQLGGRPLIHISGTTVCWHAIDHAWSTRIPISASHSVLAFVCAALKHMVDPKPEYVPDPTFRIPVPLDYTDDCHRWSKQEVLPNIVVTDPTPFAPQTLECPIVTCTCRVEQ